MIISLIARLLGIALIGSFFPHTLLAQTKDDHNQTSYITCKSKDEPTQEDVVNCANKIDLQWQGCLVNARAQQKKLIDRQGTADVLQ
jgi:hypothetical protein